MRELVMELLISSTFHHYCVRQQELYAPELISIGFTTLSFQEFSFLPTLKPMLTEKTLFCVFI